MIFYKSLEYMNKMHLQLMQEKKELNYLMDNQKGKNLMAPNLKNMADVPSM